MRYSIKYTLTERVFEFGHGGDENYLLGYTSRRYRRTVKAKDLISAVLKFENSILKKYGQRTRDLIQYDQIWESPDVLPPDKTWRLLSRTEINSVTTF